MTGVEAEWDPDNGKYKLYTKYGKEIAGDDIGAFFSFDTAEGEQIEVELGVSFVSIENARLNLNKEQKARILNRYMPKRVNVGTTICLVFLLREGRKSRRPFSIRPCIIC